MNFEVLDFPWSHGYSKNFVDDQFAKQMSDDIPEWDSPAVSYTHLTLPTKRIV